MYPKAAGVLKGSLALLGIVAVSAAWWTGRNTVLSGRNDFVMFYAGGHLAGSRDLYNRARIRQVELETAGATGESLPFTRPPYYAVLLWPLGRLPYRVAYVVWQGLAVAAVIAFICLWPYSSRWAALLACCWSLALSASFANGQDCAFLLLWIVLVLRLRETRPFLAGLLLALCAVKFQLFLLVPLLIALQRRWILGAGLLAGGTAMLAISFWSGGETWPMDYYAMLTSHKIPGEHIMPNLHGLVLGAPHRQALEILLAASVAVAVGVAARRLPFEQAMAATLAGGLLVSNHAYPADAVVLIPALLLLMARAGWRWLRGVAFVLLIPIWYLMLMVGGAQGHFLRLGLLLVVYAMAVEAWQTRDSPREVSA